MTQNRVCKKLGINYPIIQGGMLGFSKSRLASAVSNAGGLGLLAGAIGLSDEYPVSATSGMPER